MRAVTRVVVVVIVVVLIVAAGAAYTYADSASASASSVSTLVHSASNNSPSAASLSTNSTSAAASAKAVQIEIPDARGEPGSDGGAQFNPQLIMVVIGVNNTVTWTNMDQVTHDILTASGYFFSGDLSTRQTYSFTFLQAGTYRYYCSYFPIMSGMIIVKNQ